jgi:hypothetical protein
MNSTNIVFGDPNLVLSILSFLYEKTDRPYEFLINTPIALHILSFKSLYYEFHKLPNLQIQSQPIHYISSLSVFQWAIAMGYCGNIKQNNNLLNSIIESHKDQAIHFIDYIITTQSSNCYHYQIAEYASMYGDIHLLEHINSVDWIFFIEHGQFKNLFNNLYKVASQFGHLHIIQWLRAHNGSQSKWNKKINYYSDAVQYGHLHIIQWLRAQNPPCPWSVSACYSAAQYGRA